jgi:cytochrome c-type biogenesis protein CcmH
MFYSLSIAIAVLTGVALCWPMLKQSRAARNYGLSLVLALPIIALLLYQQVGSPQGIGVSGTPQGLAAHPAQGDNPMDAMIAKLEERLQQNPADLEGWVLLGRSYKTLQQYSQAQAALLRAIQLAPDDPLVLAELAEAKLFASGNPTIGPDARAMLERALSIDPGQQKALWLLGIAASQDGDDATAIAHWQKLVGLAGPDSPVAASVQQMIDQAQTRLGSTEPLATVAPAARLVVEVSFDQPEFELPEQATLFLIVRDPATSGPPLGAKRVDSPVFPVTLNLSDADSMMAERPISGTDPVEIVARISLNGSPVAGPGDPESQPAVVSPASQAPVKLEILAPAG